MDRIHNKHPKKTPNNQCTVYELAVRLLNMETNIEVNFSENKDGSDYWGAQKLVLFDQEVIIFGYYGGLAWQKYEVEKDVLFDMVRHLCYHLTKRENDIVYLFESEKQKLKEEIDENIVSSFFYYMWNAWHKEECQKIFGGEWEHFWNKWIHHTKKTTRGAAEKFYADLDTGNRIKLVKCACELYNGSTRRE